MRADWTASGACTSGSTAHRGGATRREGLSGGAAMTSTGSAEPNRGFPWRQLRHARSHDGVLSAFLMACTTIRSIRVTAIAMRGYFAYRIGSASYILRR